jgi:hypothetical protein
MSSSLLSMSLFWTRTFDEESMSMPSVLGPPLSLILMPSTVTWSE